MLELIQTFLTLDNIIKAIYLMNFLISLFLIFVDRKSPTATLAWIMVMYMLPVIGLVMYLLFSQNIARMKVNKMTSYENDRLQMLITKQKQIVAEANEISDNETIRKWSRLAMLNLDYSDAMITYNSNIRPIYDGVEFFNQLKSDIENAKHSVKLCFFIIKDDEVGNELIDVLTRKAREGVKVRLLMDAMGSRSIGNRNLKAFKEAGGDYAFYFKPVVRHLFLRFNYRNHRKIATIDNEIGYIGGFNIAREYLGRKKKFGYWRDTMIRFTGDGLLALNGRFYKDWRYASGEDIDIADKASAYVDTSVNQNVPLQIVSSGPDSPKEEIKLAMLRMIAGARKSIYVQTPYFVPDPSMIEALSMAARSGVKVNLMIPCMPDHMFVYRTTLLNAGQLLKDGANVYIYDNGFIHAKTLVVDDEVCTVGSCNFDIRSFRLNFESNAVIYDTDTAINMRKQFEKDMELSHPYTLEDREHLSMYEHLAESVSRLLTEIL